MKLLDTVVLIGAINPEDEHHERCLRYLDELGRRNDLYVPSAVLLELDLELKSHGYTDEERRITFEDLSAKIPQDRILPLSIPAMVLAIELQSEGLSYFDSLVAAQALVLGAEVVTTDREIARVVRTAW